MCLIATVVRRRRFSILTLDLHQYLERPLSDMTSVFSRTRGAHTMYDLLSASQTELQSELSWAANREGSRAKYHGHTHASPLSIEKPDAFQHVLAAWELKHLKSFLRLKGTAIC